MTTDSFPYVENYRHAEHGLTEDAGESDSTSSDDNSLTGSSGDDNLFGGFGDDSLTDNSSDDSLAGGSGNDQLNGELGDDSLVGGDGDDSLAGGSGNDQLNGELGDDSLIGGGGNDNLGGGAGIDTAVFGGNSSAYTIGSMGASVSGPDGSDTLSNIERLQFSDKSLAFDMAVSEAGGKTALLLGACLGANGLNDKATVGGILDYFNGGYTLTDAATTLVGAGIVAQLAGGADNKHFVDWIYLNVADALPDAVTEATLISYITSGQFTQATFLATVAGFQLNQDHIGLVGLQDNGMEYYL